MVFYIACTLIKSRIPNKLKHYRETHEYTLNDIAFILELKTTSRIIRWEKGTVIPGSRHLFKLARLYRTLPHDLLDVLYQIEVANADTAENKLKEKKHKFNDSS